MFNFRAGQLQATRFYVFLLNELSVSSISRMAGVNYAGHSGRTVKGMNSLRSLERWNNGFESNSRHGCLCAFILCLCCSVRR
jgi:hypothetical protein